MEDRDNTFFCNRREMLVAKDTTDCISCPMRTYPSPCTQYKEYFQLMKAGKLGYIPAIYADKIQPPDVTE